MSNSSEARAYKKYLEWYLGYLDRNPGIEKIYISDGHRLKVEDSVTDIYRFGISESEFIRLDKMMSGELKVLINEQEYENEILSFDKESIVIRLKGIRKGRIEKVCFAGDAEFLKRITEKQMGILDSLHENQNNLNRLFGDFEGAERVPCSFEAEKVERNLKQKEAVEFSVGVKDLFLIWGPPGTGKSTIVPDIIRNYLAMEKDAKILVCSYTNRAADIIVDLICKDNNLKNKIVRVGPSQIKDVTLGDIINSERFKLEKAKRDFERGVKKHHDEEERYEDTIRRSDSEEWIQRFEESLKYIRREIATTEKKIKEIESLIGSFSGKKLLSQKEIIATTNLRIFNSIFDELHFDLAIMDEAGFTDFPAALGPFVKSDKIILIGDHKQLRPITPNEGEIEEHIDRHKFIEKSIFELRWKRKQTENQGTLLNVQHRMRKEIADFISEEFYNGGLETDERIEESSNLRDAEDPVISSNYPLVFINIRALEKRDGGSPFCLGEIEVINRIVKGFAKHNGNGIYDKIGVITPFRAQRDRIKDKLPKGVACGTIHAFQGHEKAIVIYSTVRQKVDTRSPLYHDERLLNVAVSRARDRFILVGNEDVLNQIPHYKDFIAYAERYGRVYEEIPIKYDYTNRCEYCGRPIEKKWRFCWNCNEAINYEKENGGLIQFIDGMIVRTRGEMSAKDGHWVRSEGEKQIDIWFQEHSIDGHSINHRYEMDVRQYLFSMDEKSERDLSDGTISGRLGLRRIFRENGILLSGDAVVARTREEDEREISDYENNETYSIEKKGGKRNVYKNPRIPMWCDWYLPDYSIYVEYWGMMGDTHYQRRREKKEAEYDRLQLKLLSIERDDLDNLDKSLCDRLQDFGVRIDQLEGAH